MTRANKPRIPTGLTPEEGFAWLAAQERKRASAAGNSARSGSVSNYQRRLEERSVVALATAVARHEAKMAIPLSERAHEYVICRDEFGRAIGAHHRAT